MNAFPWGLEHRCPIMMYKQAQKRIRDKEGQVKIAKRQLQLHRIDVDMERICYNIEQVCSAAGLSYLYN